MNLLVFQNPFEFKKKIIYVSENTIFEKKIEAISVQLSVQSSEKSLCVIWNLCTKTYQKFVNLLSFFKIFKNVKK